MTTAFIHWIYILFCHKILLNSLSKNVCDKQNSQANSPHEPPKKPSRQIQATVPFSVFPDSDSVEERTWLPIADLAIVIWTQFLLLNCSGMVEHQ